MLTTVFWRRLCPCVVGVIVPLLLIVLLAQPASADEEQPEDCASASSPAWTQQEAWIWQKTCSRETADLNEAGTFGTAPGVDAAEDWSDSRIVSSKFLVDILTEPKYSNFTSTRSVAIAGARYPDSINLDDASIEAGIYLWSSRFESSFSLVGAKIDGALSFENSYVTGPVEASAATLGSAVFRGGHFASDVRLIGTTIEQNLELQNSNVAGKVEAGNTAIKAALLESGHFASEVDFIGSEIKDAFSASAASFDKGLDLGRATIGGGVFVDRGTVAGELNMTDAILRNRFTGWDATFRGPVSMYNTVVENQIYLGGANFSDNLYMNGTRLEGVLVLAGGSQPIKWQGDGVAIDLRGASAEGIDDTPDAWPENVWVSGFNLSGPRSYGYGDSPFIGRDANWYLDWLSRDSRLSSASYTQLETLLNTAGRRSEAIKIGMARASRENSLAGGLQSVASPLHLVTVGYGYHPEWVLPWIIGFIIIGALVARLLPQTVFDEAHAPSRVILSAHRLIPLISFGKGYADVDVTSKSVPRPVRWYFYAHAIIGYVLAAILVTALAGITSTGLN